MDGILPLWKERGMTSHDCVFKLRKILHTKKIGHGGTLDPDVEGVLPICVGKGTKVIEYMVDSGKTYEGEITLGFATTTEDVSGEIVEKKPVTAPLSTEQIDQAMAEMTGEITLVNQFLTNPLKHKVGGLKWSVAKEPMCGHYPWILAKN